MTHTSSPPLAALRRAAAAVTLAAAIIVPVWAAVDTDDLESLGFDETQIHQSLFNALRGWYNAPDVPSLVRALPTEDRVAVVNTLGAFAKAYFGSPGFKKEYLDAFKQAKPKRFGLPSLNVKDLAKSAAQKAVEGEKKAEPNALDKNPKVQLGRRLRAFLDATEDVDFDAATQRAGSYTLFVKQEYEAKPAEWKMCYRAGKETTEAIRAFARDWLAELE